MNGNIIHVTYKALHETGVLKQIAYTVAINNLIVKTKPLEYVLGNASITLQQIMHVCKV